MMEDIDQITKEIFVKGSKNFYTSSFFFSRRIKQRISILYAFVRILDDFVDSKPQKIMQFEQFEQKYHQRIHTHRDDEDRNNTANTYTDRVLDAFVALQQECAFEQEWVDAFFHSMRLDISKTEYNSEQEIRQYMYGSAEIVGLCVMRIIGVDPMVDNYARLFGRALQYINFIRDIAEDNDLGRRYLPLPAGMTSLSQEHAEKHYQQFTDHIRQQIDLFLEWVQQGTKGLEYVPRLNRIPLQTVKSIFVGIAKKIYRDPFSVYRKKVGMSHARIVLYALAHIICIGFQPKASAPNKVIR